MSRGALSSFGAVPSGAAVRLVGPMRFLHLADTHLGFRQFAGRLDPVRGINQREADVYRAWHHAVGYRGGVGVDAVVHAGDLFDGPRPTPRAMARRSTASRACTPPASRRS